ncbi:peptidoglycan DD-metalloendopeptidase family protein [Patescibacteria group bacterium]|nr:peptidoglycan DD-metalloendopeptidase family protein [Patescibacteria group bacterium]MBU4601306.1 peptidoglycan DD-metalloendopeptidase family protein [Patescibacteria group bacterium]MCG2697702.1 peptidoglycan DD-metalloendopeptidase family protein [Candidatus Parcubacteria bacterium]
MLLIKKTTKIKFFIPVLFFGLIFCWTNFVFSQAEYAGNINDEVKEINKEIKEKNNRIDEIQKKQEIYQKTIKQKQADQANLKNQLAILENRIAKAELDIESAQIEVDRVNLELKKVSLEIEDRDEQIEKEKEHLASVLRLMHKQDSKTSLEILLLNNSFSDFISEIKYLEDINSEIGDSVDDLKEHKLQLEEKQIVLLGKEEELKELKKELEDKKTLLLSEQQNRTFVLDQTKSSEKEFQELLRLAREEQQQAEADIVNLEKIVRAKIAQTQGEELEFNDTGFIWPVNKNLVTSFFHDPDYPFRYIFEHPGIDIRAGQGTELKAAASGYVAIAKDAGKGYSYIMIVHGDGLATVYGHVSGIYVKEDEYVVQGQAIGRSGGMPGTPGAGRLTTGPHLHFEVRFGGIPVNPLEYLP